MLNGDIGRKIIDAGKRRARLLNRDSVIFLFFLALAFFFWFLNGLSKEVETVVRYPVRYVNPPTDQVLQGNLPSRLDFTVRGPGYSVVKLKLLGSRVPAVIDISRVEYMIVSMPESQLSYILSDQLRGIFRRQIRADFDIIDITPDTLFFSFDEIISRRVAIVPDIDVSVDAQYILKGSLMVDPDSVTVTGPRQILDTITHISTQFRRISGVDRNTKLTLNLEGHREISLSERRADVLVSVEPITEAKLELAVEILNNEEGVNVRLFPQNVTVNLMVAVSGYQRVTEANIRAVIDLSEIDIYTVDKLPVKIVNVPPMVNAMRYAPKEVDFLIDDLNR